MKKKEGNTGTSASNNFGSSLINRRLSAASRLQTKRHVMEAKESAVVGSERRHLAASYSGLIREEEQLLEQMAAISQV